MAIRLITLDLDDTLWPCAPVIQAAEEHLYQWLSREAEGLASRHDPLSLRQHRLDLARTRPEIAHDLTRLRHASLSSLLREAGYPEHLADQAMEVFLAARNRVTPFPEVIDVLATLRERYQLISVTNGNADLEQTSLRGLFHRNLTAAEVGAARPDPTLFTVAMDHSGTRPGETLHVGDDPVLDVEAARQAGMRNVWMNRDDRNWPADVPPAEHRVKNLNELMDWLSRQD